MKKNRKSIYNNYVKRGLDIVLSFLLILVLTPLYLLLALAVCSESGPPVFYRGERGGYLGKPFRIFKFRTMVQNADKSGSGTTSLNDSRVTGTGRFLRKTKLDEIPQLFNILRGEMSFIGPRPELLKYTSNYQGTEKKILTVRPGITDYSSIEFINLDEIVGEKNADEAYETQVLPRKNRLRIQYADTVSFATDCRLFVLTVLKVTQKALGYILR